MKKIFIAIFILSSLSLSAQNKTWSFYVNGGVGTNTATHAESLIIPEESKQFLLSKGITHSEISSDLEYRVNYSVDLGVARYLTDWLRLGINLENQNIQQSNYHALGFAADANLGFDLLPKSKYHELILEPGVGVYQTLNHYYLQWRGVWPNGETVVNPVTNLPEEYVVDLGEHNTTSVSIPLKLSYQWNFANIQWFGVYAQARYIISDI